MAAIKKFEDIVAWQMARELNRRIGKLIDQGRFGNSFKFIGQIESSCGSIMDNIAEGFERGSNPVFIYFLSISKGSSAELRSQLYRALDRKFIITDEHEELSTLARRTEGAIQNFINYLNSHTPPKKVKQ